MIAVLWRQVAKCWILGWLRLQGPLFGGDTVLRRVCRSDAGSCDSEPRAFIQWDQDIQSNWRCRKESDIAYIF